MTSVEGVVVGADDDRRDARTRGSRWAYLGIGHADASLTKVRNVSELRHNVEEFTDERHSGERLRRLDREAKSLQVIDRAGVVTEKVWFNFAPGRVHWASFAGTSRTVSRSSARPWAGAGDAAGAHGGTSTAVRFLAEHLGRLRGVLRDAAGPAPRPKPPLRHGGRRHGRAVGVLHAVAVVPRAPSPRWPRRAHPVRPRPPPLRQPYPTRHARALPAGRPAEHFDAQFNDLAADLDAHGALEPMRSLDGRLLVALDGAEFFRSRTIHCDNCSTRKRADGGTEHSHQMLGVTVAVPAARTRGRCPRSSRSPGTAPTNRTASGRRSSAGCGTTATRSSVTTFEQP